MGGVGAACQQKTDSASKEPRKYPLVRSCSGFDLRQTGLLLWQGSNNSLLPSKKPSCYIANDGDLQLIAENIEHQPLDQDLTRSERTVLSILRGSESKGLTPGQIIGEVSFAPRTVRYALRKLLEMKLVKRYPCLQDMRQYVYLPK
jgi:hypothetical protein